MENKIEQAFTKHAATLDARGVANRGVDPALVNRYFVKSPAFAEAVKGLSLHEILRAQAYAFSVAEAWVRSIPR